MSTPTPSLDTVTLLAQIDALGRIGANDDAAAPADGRNERGRTRLALSDAERAGRDQLLAWLREAGLQVQIDRIGNIFGVLPAQSEAGNARPLMIGSHIDTVANAGALDGCYGVLAGLAVARAWREAGLAPKRALVVAAFTNEEGARYQPDMLGSLVYAGGLDVQAALDTVGIDGTRLGDELARIGYAGDMEPGAIVPHAYLELHIEQGPVLDAAGETIGVVETLQGISWQRVTVRGTANHAGTTPTRLRHDAGYVAGATIAFLREQIAAASATTLATVGALELEPNLINVIARQASFTVDIRDPGEARLQAAESRLAEFLATLAAREGVAISTERLARFEPVVFDAGLVAAIEASAQRLGLPQRRMTSGAGHDAQMLARIAPAAMIFVPSRDGISHNPREHTEPAHLIAGAQVLLDVATRLLET